MRKKTTRKDRVRHTRVRKTHKRPFVEPEIMEQEPLKRVIQQTCTITSAVLCFG